MKKTNNKGFSLVELIVVIAIMAVLIAVLAPSFLRYVEKSRNSTDMQNAASIVNAVQVWAVDSGLEGSSVMSAGEYDITITETGVSTPVDADIEKALKNAGLMTDAGVCDIKCQSRTRLTPSTGYTITFTVADNGSMTVTYNPAWIGNPNTTGTN